ncbi:MAG TPA: DUF559 domain-containing protein [Armatimonadota bacterium]|jgi:very-short-patch-repair endonuclease
MKDLPLNTSGIVTGNHPPELRERAGEFRRAMTPMEKRLWAQLQGSRLNGLHFRRQQVIDRFIVDFYCHQAGLVVEVDGEVHADATARDAERDSFLHGRGLLVVRFSNLRVRADLPGVLSEIREAATARLSNGPTP